MGSLTAASVSAPSPATAKPVAYTSPAAPVLISAPPPNSSNTANPPARASLPDKPASAGPDSKPSGTETKRKVEGALTAAAIARSSWRPAVPNITREGGSAPAQTTLCGVVEPAAAERLFTTGRCGAALLSERRDSGNDRRLSAEAGVALVRNDGL